MKSYLMFLASLAISFSAVAQNKTVSGRVTNENGNPVVGASVTVKGTSNGTTTNTEGQFSISVEGTSTLLFSSIGYTPAEVKVNGRSEINMQLTSEAAELGNVLLIGYGTQKKKDLIGAISSLKPDDYKGQPLVDATSALQGRVAGLEISNTSGAPGSVAKIHIRGANSINSSNTPLYVVDGVALNSIGLQDININDIASMEVLKDASATAIYGSRGANGVILITTKSGKSGKIKVDYNGFLNVAHPMNRYKLLDAVDFAKQANYIVGTNVFPDPGVFAGKSTDWQNMVFQNGLTQSHQVSVSGGTEKSKYYISGYYVDQSGLLVNTSQKKYALRSNLESKISNKAIISLGVFLSRTDAKNNGDIGGKGNPVTGALAWSPTEPVYDSLKMYNRNAVSPIWPNPYMILKERDNETFSNQALLNGKLTYDFTNWLSLDIVVGLNLNNAKSAYLNNDWMSPGNPSSGQGQADSYTFQNSNILTFHKRFNEVHDLKIVGLEEASSNKYSSFNAQGAGLSSTSNGYYNLGLNSSQSIYSDYSKWALLSFVGRASYSYKDKYLISATFRADGSSKFQNTNKKWGYFPSVGAGWRLSDEPFIKNLNLFSNLKLRGSYGVTGSQAIAPYSSLGLLTPVQYSFGTSVLYQGYMQGNPANPGLGWEETDQTDVGLDMGFWENRLNVTLDYYYKKTKDLLLNTPIPAYDGGGTFLQNIGVVNNKGLELSIDVTPVQTTNLKWTTTFNASLNRNKVVSLGKDSVLFRSDFVGQGFINTNIQVVKVGESLGTFFLIPWEGVYNSDDPALGYKAGDNKYKDVNGDGKIDFADRVIAGSAMPKVFLGWNNNFRYKNFDLNLFFQASLGNKIFNATYAIIAAPNSDVYYPTLAASANYWTPQNTSAVWANPASKTGRNFTESTQYLQDGSYCRLKNLSISYSLPKGKFSSVNAAISVSAQNLLTITGYKGYDPEASSTPSGSDASAGIDFGAYPSPKTLSIGLHLEF